jgi:hypothetical protein
LDPALDAAIQRNALSLEVAMLYGTVILGLPLFVVGATFGQEH